MKTYECIARSGSTGKQIVLLIRAVSASNAQMDALKQARQLFGSRSGAVFVDKVTEIK